MKYELAKQLKEAGFPLRLVMGAGSWNGDKVFFDNDVAVTGEKIGFLPPTLSELIEACGDDTDGNRNIDHPFSSLNLLADFKTWEAEAWFTTKTGKGLTPEEAVANLWLELNKK